MSSLPNLSHPFHEPYPTRRNTSWTLASSHPSLSSHTSLEPSCYFSDSPNVSISCDESTHSSEHFNPDEALALVDRCFSVCGAKCQDSLCRAPSIDPTVQRGASPTDGIDSGVNFEDSTSIESFVSTNSCINLRFSLRIGRIQVSWKRAQPNCRDEYHLKAYLLLDQEESVEDKKKKSIHRQWDQILLTESPIVSTNLTVGYRNNIDRELVTEICFNDQELQFATNVAIEKLESAHKFQFRNKVVRLKLERCKPGRGHSHSLSIGFVDIDLAQFDNLKPQSNDAYRFYPMIVFREYHRQMLRHRETPASQFTFEIGLKIHHQIILDSSRTDFDVLNNNSLMERCNLCSSKNIHKVFGRQDSMANLSKDIELKYHDLPVCSKRKHLLNILGILPPAQLYRVSIHFGHIDPDDHSELKKSLTKGQKLYASFEIKHHSHQPTIFHHHHQRHSVITRTKNLDMATSPLLNYDQNFTFFERFHFKDAPNTSLSLVDAAGNKMFKFKSSLAEYVYCRSVKQYFTLKNKKQQYCRLQFSISVKPVSFLD